MNEHIERIFTEANRRFYSGIPIEEMGSAQVDEIELRSFLRTALTSTYNMGKKDAGLMLNEALNRHSHPLSEGGLDYKKGFEAAEDVEKELLFSEKIESSPEL